MLEAVVFWVVDRVRDWGYTGIAVMMFVESSFFPFPSEVAMVPAGYLAAQGEMDPFIATAVGKVDPVEVERCISGHPDVQEVVVLGAKLRTGDEAVKAVIVPRREVDEAHGPALRRELIARCRERLAEFKVPRQLEFRREIPRSALGKVLRKYLV